jgi:hypothetical protein
LLQLVELGEKCKCKNQQEVQNDDENEYDESTVYSDSKDANRKQTRWTRTCTRSRNKAMDENTQPALTNSEKK